MASAFFEIRNSLPSDDPIGPRDLLAWCELQEIDDGDRRRSLWSFVRRVDTYVLGMWSEARKARMQPGNIASDSEE